MRYFTTFARFVARQELLTVSSARIGMQPKEFQLLLYCARSRPDAEQVKDLVGKGIDWQLLLKLATQHCVRPMLLQSLKSVCWNAVPQSIQQELTLFIKANAQKNLFFTGELLRLLRLFEQNAIPIAAIKGPVLAYSLYDDISLREFSDLDVIVQEKNLPKAEDILTACGYEADFADRDYRSAFLRYQGQYAFRNSQSGISVDVHWRLSSKGAAFPLQLAEIWPRLEKVTIAGRPVLTLAHDDLALFLAGHGTKERWRSLVWVCDFAEFLRKYQDIDWVEISDRAQRSHSSHPLLLAIFLASDLLGAAAPLLLINEARSNPSVRELAKQAKLRMLQPEAETEVGKFLGGLRTHDRLRHKLSSIVTLLTTRTVGDSEALHLPKFLWGAYFFTRPFRLTAKAVKMIVRRNTSGHGD
jgi:hypothetical protein